MSKLTNQPITKKDLEVFTKDELIYFILRCSWGNLWNPLEVIYQKRMDDNFQKSRGIGVETKKLIDKMNDKNYEELYQISLEIDKLNKIRDKLSKENDRIMKILYWD
ncbi:hypothetical protein [Tissierella praeacuta]|uniref:hypothetical protein n=1 Tax=Tissierella praeacuta TaxID=43131 RepID=UPI00333E5551